MRCRDVTVPGPRPTSDEAPRPGPPSRLPPLLARLTLQRPRRRRLGYLVASVGTFAFAAALIPFRDDLTPLSVGFGFLVVVVVAAALGRARPRR